MEAHGIIRCMNIFLIILSIIFFVIFILGAIFNIQCWIKPQEEGKHNPSIIPLFPGIIGCVSLAIFPLYPLIKIAWLPLVLDVGCLPYFIGASSYLLHDWWITNPVYKIKELHSHSPDFKLEVKLYRTGQVRLLKTNLVPPSRESTSRWLSISRGGEWVETQNKLILQTLEGKITYEKITPHKYLWISSETPTSFDNIDITDINATQ